LEHKLGEGGMSVVWHAWDEVLDRPVAVKVLAGRYAADAGSRRRILAEAKAAGRLSHPNVASVFDYGESEGDDGEPVPYIVMELLTGRTLAQRLGSGPLSVNASLRTCAEVASALAAAHAQDLVHRDVKPANIVLTRAGAKVVDFGIAAIAGAPTDTSADGPVLGTPAYLAPERLTGGDVVPASDVYALGVLLYRLIVGRLPWLAETTTQMLTAHAYVDPLPLPPLDDVGPEVNDLFIRCLAKEPADRPTAYEAAVVLAEALGGRPAAVDDLDGSPALLVVRPPVRRKRERRAVPVALALLVAASVGALVVAFSGSLGGSDPPASGSHDRGVAAGRGNAPVHPTTTGPADPTAPVNGGSGQNGGAGANDPGATEGPVSPIGPGGTTPGTPAPTGPVPTTPGGGRPSPSPTPSFATGVTLTSPGGSVVASCTVLGVYVESWTPNTADGYSVQQAEHGPRQQVTVVFRANRRPVVTMRISCVDGVPQAAVEITGAPV
jgi:serine/threonine-protein kinase